MTVTVCVPMTAFLAVQTETTPVFVLYFSSDEFRAEDADAANTVVLNVNVRAPQTSVPFPRGAELTVSKKGATV